MPEMTSRERVLRTFRFEKTDRAPFDLMESVVWDELQDWFTREMGLANKDQVLDHFGVDFRWFWAAPEAPDGVNLKSEEYLMTSVPGSWSDHVVERPLKDVRSVSGLAEKHKWIVPEWWNVSPARDFRKKYQDKAIVMLVHHTMLFMTACEFFGAEEALVRLASADEVMTEFLRCQCEFAVNSFQYACNQVQGAVDVCWLMDDVATQRALMMHPSLWRDCFKEFLRREVKAIHDNNMFALFHSCGSIRDILPDLIEIGIDGVLPFQTTARGMDADSIAKDFGGKILFYGGMDIQQLLTFGSEEDVRREVRKNIDLFAAHGGYVVANSHHCIQNIKPENICAMLDEARNYRSA